MLIWHPLLLRAFTLCVLLYIYRRIHTYTFTYTHTPTHTHTPTYTHTHIHLHTHIHSQQVSSSVWSTPPKWHFQGSLGAINHRVPHHSPWKPLMNSGAPALTWGSPENPPHCRKWKITTRLGNILKTIIALHSPCNTP